LIVSGGLVRGENGAGVLVDTANSNLNHTYVQVTGNHALPTSVSGDPVGGIGGGIYSMGNVTLTASSITGNQGDTGGGGVAIHNGALTLTQTSYALVDVVFPTT